MHNCWVPCHTNHAEGESKTRLAQRSLGWACFLGNRRRYRRSLSERVCIQRTWKYGRVPLIVVIQLGNTTVSTIHTHAPQMVVLDVVKGLTILRTKVVVVTRVPMPVWYHAIEWVYSTRRPNWVASNSYEGMEIPQIQGASIIDASTYSAVSRERRLTRGREQNYQDHPISRQWTAFLSFWPYPYPILSECGCIKPNEPNYNLNDAHALLAELHF